jgi:nucleotide-binding universal stress UspA family protein
MFKKILIPLDIDYPKTAAAVYRNTVKIAEISGAEIKLLGVMPGFSMPIVASYISDELKKETIKHYRTSFEEFIQTNCDKETPYSIRIGKHWEEIIKGADKWRADLIVVYHNHRRDINEVFSGSCSARVMEHANCSVLRLRNVMS